MGTYTGLHLAIELRNDTPQRVIELLRIMTGEDDKYGGLLPDHPLFHTGRWPIMLRCDSYYHAAQAGRALVYDDNVKAHFLTVLSSFKNYDGEIDKFADWISPYIAPTNARWIGYSWHEEDEEPKPLYRREVLPEVRS